MPKVSIIGTLQIAFDDQGQVFGADFYLQIYFNLPLSNSLAEPYPIDYIDQSQDFFVENSDFWK